MPGNVGNATAAAVLPGDLATAFSRVTMREVALNLYGDGRASAAKRTTSARMRWRLEYSLAPNRLTALRAFWLANRHRAILFYDRMERREEGLTPLYDETGVATGAGVYEVRFEGEEWAQENALMRGSVGLELVEIT